jgi:hypothetical protein
LAHFDSGEEEGQRIVRSEKLSAKLWQALAPKYNGGYAAPILV